MKNQKTYSIGIDIGGTNMRAGLFDGEKIIANYELATPKDSLKHFLIMIKALVEPILEITKKEKLHIVGLGVGCAGALNQEKNKILKSPNIPILNNVFLPKEIEKIIGLPVKLDNDAKCFLRAEMTLGSGKKFHNAFGLIIGTGIGGAWWREGKIYYGHHGSAGEPGRMIIDYTNQKELEAIYQELTQSDPLELANRALHADALAEQAFDKIGEIIGLTFANIINLIDPEVIIIGGGVSGSSDLFLNKAKMKMAEFIMNPTARKEIKILKSKLGGQAGMIGAALLQETNFKTQDTNHQ
jgi:glucokinase